MKNFRQLKIWQKGFQISLNCFQITESLPKIHQWGIGHQLNKSAVSIPSNIAEGNSRSSEKDKKRYMEIALGSTFEADTQLSILKAKSLGDLNLIDSTLAIITEEGKMLNSYIEKLGGT